MSIVEPLIDIIIPNWNGERMLKDCLRSLAKQTFDHYRIIIVDNGSKDGSVNLIERDFPLVKLIRLSENTGFSVAVNKGIEESSAPWILLLNNDMEVAADCLQHLNEGVEKYKDYHFFALKMMNFHNRNLLDGAGDAVLRGGVGYRLGTMEKDSDFYRRDRDTFGACAGAGLYKREFFNRTGLFDADFFAYLEDVDLNMRARRLGLKCRYLSSAVVYHIGSATSGSKVNGLTIRLSTRNNFSVLLKNYSLWMFVRFLLPILVFQLMWLLFSLKKGMMGPYFRGIVQAARLLPKCLAKRKGILASQQNIPESELVKLISAAERDAVSSIMMRRKTAGKGNFLLLCYCKIFLL